MIPPYLSSLVGQYLINIFSVILWQLGLYIPLALLSFVTCSLLSYIPLWQAGWSWHNPWSWGTAQAAMAWKELINVFHLMNPVHKVLHPIWWRKMLLLFNLTLLQMQSHFKNAITVLNSHLERWSQIEGSGQPLEYPWYHDAISFFSVQVWQFQIVSSDSFQKLISNLYSLCNFHMSCNSWNDPCFLPLTWMQIFCELANFLAQFCCASAFLAG